MRKVSLICTFVLTLAFILIGVLLFSGSYARVFAAVKDLGLSVGYYFCELFGIEYGIVPTVNVIPEFPNNGVLLPDNWQGLCKDAVDYFNLLFNWDNFLGWIAHISWLIYNFTTILIMILPCLFICGFIIKILYRRRNNKYGKDTVPLKVFKAVSRFTYQPIKQFVRGYIAFIKKNSKIIVVWGLIWAVNFNLCTILIEFIAYYLYFAITYDFASFYTQIVKLINDLKVPFTHFPYYSLLVVLWVIFDRYRRKIALFRLRHMEAKNCGFINELPIVSMTCGSMGKKKTTAITDMALSQEVMFRQRAFEILQNNDMKFSMFPWIQFEKELQACMEHGTVYNLATAKDWVRLKRSRFEKHGNVNLQLYGYDIGRYGFTYDDGLKISTLFNVLEIYAQAYFIYVIESSLIVSNYSIRTDNGLLDEGNFPVWITDFFSRTRRKSHYAKVLDFDILRLGKKVIENNPSAGSFEFGVVAISEVGKERGNNLELKEVKKGGDEANQKNDLFNSWLKMCRHSATVDNFPFIKVFTDEQRPESWGADARDLCDIVNIISSSEQKLAMPFYTVEDMLSEWAFNKFIKLYYYFRFRRGDNTLLVHILKNVTAWLWKRNIKVYNTYGYSVLKIEKERGTMDKRADKKKYYLMNCKVYARRFSTDCFSDYFNDLARKAKVGLNGYREYVTERANVDELKAQNSYFINALYGIKGGED